MRRLEHLGAPLPISAHTMVDMEILAEELPDILDSLSTQEWIGRAGKIFSSTTLLDVLAEKQK